MSRRTARPSTASTSSRPRASRSRSCSIASPPRCRPTRWSCRRASWASTSSSAAELEIQRAYHWILSPDRSKGHDSSFGGSDDPETAARNQQTYDQNYWQTKNTELRVSRVAFVDANRALVTYRAYYGGVPSSVVRTPLTGVAEQIDGLWRLSSAGLCELSQAANIQCAGSGGPTTADVIVPPNGWNAVDSVPGLADAYRVLADPTSTVDQRLAVVDRGDQLRDAIDAGANADASRTNVSFVVSGARLVDATHAQILYSVIADGDTHLETPYPLVGNAVLVDGAWKASSRYACGLTALATLACPAAAALPTTTTTPPTTTTADDVDHRSCANDCDHCTADDDRPRLGRGADHARHPDVDCSVTRAPAGVASWRWRRRKRMDATSPAGSGNQYENRR